MAAAVGADELVFLSDVPGVLDADGAVIPEIQRVGAARASTAACCRSWRRARTALAAGVRARRASAPGTVVTA